MTGGPPSRIDRDALERIIRRATELQTGSRDIGDALTPEEVIALGRDVGIPEGYLRQAILEERTASPAVREHGALDRFMGPDRVEAHRVIGGRAEDLEKRLLAWMADEELMAIQRRQPGRITWEPLRGLQAAMRRSAAAFRPGQRPFMLSRSELVAATFTPLEPGYIHVALSATAGKLRGSFIGGAAGLAGAGVAATTVMLALGAFVWIALSPLPLAAGLALGVSRQYRPAAERIQLGLERALDQLERGSIKTDHLIPRRPPGVLGIIEEVRKTLKP